MQSDTSDDIPKVWGTHPGRDLLEPGQTYEVLVICHTHMQPGYHCLNATVVAEVPNELNPNNNVASGN